MLKNLFNEKKAAQAAAYFLFRAGEPLSILKLTKLLYLAERGSLEKFGEPMIGDHPVSMPHGPVLSTTLDYMNGMLRSSEGGWDSWIADRQGHFVALRDPQSVQRQEDLLALSAADIEILSDVWNRFGGMDQWALRDWTHEHCPEWTDPEGSSVPISFDTLLAALHFSPQQTEAILARLREADGINAAFAADARAPGR
jgi:uncharacterized phage-associated protein